MSTESGLASSVTSAAGCEAELGVDPAQDRAEGIGGEQRRGAAADEDGAHRHVPFSQHPAGEAHLASQVLGERGAIHSSGSGQLGGGVGVEVAVAAP